MDNELGYLGQSQIGTNDLWYKRDHGGILVYQNILLVNIIRPEQEIGSGSADTGI